MMKLGKIGYSLESVINHCLGCFCTKLGVWAAQKLKLKLKTTMKNFILVRSNILIPFICMFLLSLIKYILSLKKISGRTGNPSHIIVPG